MFKCFNSCWTSGSSKMVRKWSTSRLWQLEKKKGPAEIWTRIVGFRVRSANRYTTEPRRCTTHIYTYLMQLRPLIHGLIYCDNDGPNLLCRNSQLLPPPMYFPQKGWIPQHTHDTARLAAWPSQPTRHSLQQDFVTLKWLSNLPGPAGSLWVQYQCERNHFVLRQWVSFIGGSQVAFVWRQV